MSALELVAAAEAGPLDELQGARADLLRGRIAFASGPGSDAPPLLLKAAKRLEPLDLDRSRQTYVDAWQAAVFAGHLAGAGDLLEVSRAARALPPPAHPPRPVDLLLDGFAVLAIDGLTAAAPLLRQATTAIARADLPVEESLQWGWLARVADKTLWDDAGLSITSGQVQLAWEAGALDHLSIVLNMMAMDAVWGGDLVAAAAVVAEEGAVREATGSRNLPYGAMMLAAYRGREQEAAPLIQATAEQVMAGGQGAALTNAYWMGAILYNGLGRYADALTAARQASEHRHLYASSWAWPELIEAAVRAGGADEARAALDLLAGTTRAGGTDLGLGVEARCRALLAEGDAAEGYYREALDRLARTRRRPDLARAHLLYGEWLRRAPSRRRPAAAAHRLPDAGRDGHGGVRRASPPRAASHRRDNPQAQTRERRRRDDAHRPGSSGRAAGGRRAVQPGNRRPPVHQHPHGAISPEQGVLQVRDRLPDRAPPCAARRTGPRGGALTDRSRARIVKTVRHACRHGFPLKYKT